MNNDRLSDKERALLAAARREVAKQRPAPARGPRASSIDRGEAPGPGAASPAATPLDQPTVLGWDHPAANPKRPVGAVDPRLLADWPTSAMALADTTPLDQPTVLGWDNPAAKDGAAAAKWERIAQLMAQEREAAEAERRKLKRYGLIVSAVIFVVGMTVVLALWPKPGA